MCSKVIGRRSLVTVTGSTKKGKAGLRMVSILLLIVLALVFDFLNGFHDSANSIATVVSTRVLTPR